MIGQHRARSWEGRIGASARLLVASVAVASLAAACSKGRDEEKTTPTWDDDVAPLFAAKCTQCHGDASPAAGWKATTYLGAIACDAQNVAATLPADASAPLVRVLSDATHAGILSDDERDLVARWVAGKTPAFRDGIHPSGIVDPRSADFHGKFLRDRHWAPMLDGNDQNACGRCHDGTPAKPGDVTAPAPGAPACTSCHTEPNGVLACSTCHGNGTRANPPRDPCFFPNDQGGAHTAHLYPTETHAKAFTCTMCHPVPTTGDFSGSHGNGSVDVVLDPALAGQEQSWDATTHSCAVSCHDRGGERPRPVWTDTSPLGCNGCHTSPPQNHFPGACTTCHREPNADGSALLGGPFHMNGKVDLGDGSGKCGACHGRTDDDPSPGTNAHPTHENPTLTTPIGCDTCHPPHDDVLSPLHMDGTVEVQLTGRATDRMSDAQYDGQSCTNVACHGANLVDPPLVIPQWRDKSGDAKKCGTCHGLPPHQHTPSKDCQRSDCHGGEVDKDANENPFITPGGRLLHINGVFDHDRPF